MSIVLGLDFEATGLSTETDHIIEVGAVLWDTEAKMPISTFGSLVKYDRPLTLSDEVVSKTHITQSELDKFGVNYTWVFGMLNTLWYQAEYIVAHNGKGYDKPLLNQHLGRYPDKLSFHDRPWIDTMIDIPYPPDIRTRSLKYLAAEYNILNPFPHRAVPDVLTMLQLLSRFNFDEVVEYSNKPLITLVACVKINEKDLAKTRGYQWDGKLWTKSFRGEDAVQKEISECGFSTTRAI